MYTFCKLKAGNKIFYFFYDWIFFTTLSKGVGHFLFFSSNHTAPSVRSLISPLREFM